MQVNSNGVLLFTNSNTRFGSFTPPTFPYTGSTSTVVAPFWYDSDLRGSGVIYAQSCNSTNQYSEDISRTIGTGIDYQQFLPTSCLVVTWEEVGYFSSNTALVSYNIYIYVRTCSIQY